MQGPAGQHLVEYFDKSRMEINNPAGDRNSEWYVTNGLLVVDMIRGTVQVGDQQFAPAAPAQIPVAGDINGDPETPTFASLARVASLYGDNRAPNRTGQQISEGIGRTGGIGHLSNLAGLARYGVYEPTTGHNIADVFWTFMNQAGPVYENGRYVNGMVVDWLFAMGYPITEPYWIKIKVSGQERWVLMQAFQRRILTYSPYNPTGWKVEMGNVGRAYYDWRYNTPPAPTPTPVPSTSIAITPAEGAISTPITVTGRAFPAYSAVTLSVQNADASYTHTLTTLAVAPDGTFSARVILPAEAARYGKLTIVASAQGGAVKAAQVFQVQAVLPAHNEVVNNGKLDVNGVGFPPSRTVTVGLLFANTSRIQWLQTTAADSIGSFAVTLQIGNRSVGSTFKVVARSDTGFQLASGDVKVIAQPGLQVVPASGPANSQVTLQGTLWPANRTLKIGRLPVDSKSILWFDTATTDAAGNFRKNVLIGKEYAKKSSAALYAYDPVSGVQVSTSYRITP
jgi:hypothetical protein